MHSQRDRLRNLSITSQVTCSILRVAIPPIAIAALLVTMILNAPALYHWLASAWGWPDIKIPTPPPDTYSDLMSGVAQASAAMLALFFTAVSLVASTSYAKATTQTRSLLAHDDINVRYLRLLAHTSAVATAGVGLQALDMSPSFLLAGYVTVMAGVSVLAFLVLGLRIFALFDPSSVARPLIGTFMRAVHMATSKGKCWLDPSFQRHANAMAEHTLEMLADLVVLILAEKRPRQNLVVEIAKEINQLLRDYASHKHTIPSDSLWFTRRAAFKRWELANDSMASLSLTTGTALPPEPVPDYEFVENRCTEMITRCLDHLLDHDAVDDACNLLLEIEETAKTYSQLLHQAEAVNLVNAMRVVVLKHLRSEDNRTDALKVLQMVDVLGAASLAPVLYTALSLTDARVERSFEILGPVLHLDRRGSSSLPNPRIVLTTAEDFLRRLKFEKAVEGRIRTKSWYAREVIASAYAEVIRNVIQGIVKVLQTALVEPAADLIERKCPAAACVLLLRGMEGYEKAYHRIEELAARYGELEKLRISEAAWDPSGSADALAELARCRALIVERLAKILPDLDAPTRDDRLPDLRGRTRALLGDELVSMMERKDEDRFAEQFAAYFAASISVVDHWRGCPKEFAREFCMLLAADAAMDVMEVSGLAYIFSELDSTRFAEVVSRAWDALFALTPDGGAGLHAWLLAAISQASSFALISPSGIQRHRWKCRMVEALNQRGVDTRRDIQFPSELSSAELHPSPVIESLREGMQFAMPHVYFGALYLAKRLKTNGSSLPHEVASCMSLIERARKQREGADVAST